MAEHAKPGRFLDHARPPAPPPPPRWSWWLPFVGLLMIAPLMNAGTPTIPEYHERGDARMITTPDPERSPTTERIR